MSNSQAVRTKGVTVRSGNRRPDGWVPQQLPPPNVVQIARKLDALLDLLDTTADALAATWDQRVEVSGEEKFHAGDNIKPTIH
jgi:hypothetical protein